MSCKLPVDFQKASLRHWLDYQFSATGAERRGMLLTMSKEADIICIIFYINSIEYADPKLSHIRLLYLFLCMRLLLFTIEVAGFHVHMVAPKYECWIPCLLSGNMLGNC